MRFFLGVEPAWLTRPDFADVPMFVSHTGLAERRRFAPAVGPYAVDSGGYTQVRDNGRWITTVAEYAAALRRYADGFGPFEFAIAQDVMCTPDVLAAIRDHAGEASVTEAQRETIRNLVALRALTPGLPIAPVIQGWSPDEYDAHVDLYADAGVDLRAEPVVAIGSIAGRSDSIAAAVIVDRLHRRGLRLHGLGVKTVAARDLAHMLDSADSMSWSYAARRRRDDGPMFPDCTHATCSHCPRWALAWRADVLTSIAHTPQLGLPL